MSQPVALLLSLLLEVPLLLAIARYKRWCDLRQLLIVGLAATLLTHPFAWTGALWIYSYLPFPWGWLVIELAVTLAEAGLFRGFVGVSWQRALILSGLANGFSATVGLVLFMAVL